MGDEGYPPELTQDESHPPNDEFDQGGLPLCHDFYAALFGPEGVNRCLKALAFGEGKD